MIKQAQFDKAVQSLTTPALGLGGAAQIVDVVLFDIRGFNDISKDVSSLMYGQNFIVTM